MTGLGFELLKKMGWKEGTGIGKSGSGIVEPIKPKLKIGTAGIGFKESERLCTGWWMTAFNNAAAASSQPSSIKKSSSEASMLSARQGLLGRPYAEAFASSACVLRNGRELECPEAHHAKAERRQQRQQQLPPPTLSIPSDADLLAACGGRTAHAAARFGLRLGGKLARVQAQDDGGGKEEVHGEDEEEKQRRRLEKKEKKKKKKQKRKREREDRDEDESASGLSREKCAKRTSIEAEAE